MSEYDERWRPEKPGRPEHEHKQSHAGNGIVNHGPEGHGPDGQGSGGTGSAGPGPGDPGSDGPGSEGLGSDERALRLLLHQAVQEIEPTDGTLEHLRRAVPARRARKRHAAVGMAAAALFVGTAVPALLHVSNSSGPNANPSIAGNTSQTQGGSGQGKTTDGGEHAVGGSSGTAKDPGKEGQKATPSASTGADNGTATGGVAPTASSVTAPTCTADQLGGATSALGDPDSTGTVYGSFAVSNVSTTVCAVTGAGTVSTVTQGAADATKVSVVNHVAGDAATGLPDPSTEVTSLVLQPGASYVVKFAWVPSETCPTTNEPSPDPTTTDDATVSGGTSDSGGTSTQLVTEDGVAEGSITVSHTDQTGTATASTTVSNACAGTVYRTGMLAADAS
ncbi:hypothetical protein [Streptomyces sp. NBC_00038]|uniref:hypothetical protein n=1 Tax=Streptomyces sp. NBC_00038 TaxID=2903615 RepID=UPI00224C9D49|nr:hypothetical protein [Streptomyces sp. NBC_00038]MCX5559417.1 hypothetical protein [Streptomyces sp. NBC_00038]